ncbi:MAG: 16S rRNA (adenine(1518)-N(6)/adenine(1519)-N(6))-dimethyltransferase RsmA [Acidobacteriota bacterium]
MSIYNRPKKSLGQNFLHDDNVIQKIIRAFDPRIQDAVLEIGPGRGALTGELLSKLSHLTAVELDDELVASLTEAHGEKLTILHQDVLTVDLGALARERGKKLRLIGNIPYNITSPILFHVIDNREWVNDFLVMMQTEVAQRLVARPRTKEYGILSIFAQYYASPKLLFGVSKNSFFPAPTVTSAVVSLSFDKPFETTAQSDELFRTIVRGTFGKRRKTIRNGLKGLNVPPEALDALSINLEQRPEELTVADFVQLSNELMPAKGAITPVFSNEENG